MSTIAGADVGVIANLALRFAMHFLFRGNWAPLASLPLALPDLATLEPAALASSMLAGGVLHYGLEATLVVSVAAGPALRAL